ncbi:hypothetical protein GGU10DRAFT_63924 [Lentinula aff. detonsa]|uniref:SET domain-containing protein n=1 Tax=Lentinula aff. detonsa TaxID=2804958 RepID=A0AA38NTY4_9AGAR|nr:hypothetical protein GGU10DRAFT_63924 [Lentinula aff. detonsa]
MALNPSVHGVSSRQPLTWRPTKIMNMRDLSKDDDFLSHLLVEKLGTGSVPLLVHKMDSSRRLPKVYPHDLMEIVRRLVVSKGPLQHAIRSAVDELFLLAPIRYYLQNYTQKQINAFATHASRYFELYHPSGSIEISHTSRYSHHTGKSELCILATRNLAPGSVITELKGSMANLTDEEDRELKRTDLRNSDIRRDFSVIHSKSMKKNHLFLGPARFVNHDCDNNCELFREGRYITFRVLRPISIGEEITAHYGDGYFGRKNRHCLCETCEKKGRGGYAPDHTDDDIPSDSGSSDSDSDDSDSESEAVSSVPEDDANKRQVNLNERRTRRGVYAVVTKEEDHSDESDDEDGSVMPLAGASDIASPGEMEMADATSNLTSLPLSRAASNCDPAGPSRLSSSVSELTPISRSTSSLSSLSSLEGTSSAPKSSSYQSIISTRRQKAEAEAAALVSASTTLPEDSLFSASSVQTLTRTSISVTPSKGKGKQKVSSRASSTPRRSDNLQAAENGKVKDEDPRILRPRQSASAVVSESTKEMFAKPEIPRGPDGKALPICATCRNILPVISVDHQIVWGLGLEKESRKKKAKQECPRCMRHCAIYREPWPRRVPLPGCASTFNTTPREETTPAEFARKVTHKVLPVLDRKIAAVASSKRKRSSEVREAEEEHERLVKKSKESVEHAVAKKRVPIPLPEGQKRKRGRPRLMSVPVTDSVPAPAVKVEDNEEPLHPSGFKAQGRRMNGRFERTMSSSPQKGHDPDSLLDAHAGRAQRALEREKTKQIMERELLVKRGLSEIEIEQITKRGKWDDSSPHGKELPLKRVFPKRSTSFRSGNLFSRPNPMSFAARAWANPLVSDDGSSEDEKGPDTPEDSQSPPAIMEVELEDWDRGPSLIVTAPAVPPAYKPSPFSFARRRWSSLSASPVEDSRKSVSEVKTHMDARPPLNMERILDNNSYNTTSTFKDRPSTYERWNLQDVSSSEEEDTRDLFTLRVTPFREDEVNKRPLVLQHTYPSEVVYTQGPVFTPDLSLAPPNFIAPNFNDAGWESDSSDL